VFYGVCNLCTPVIKVYGVHVYRNLPVHLLEGYIGINHLVCLSVQIFSKCNSSNCYNIQHENMHELLEEGI